MAEEIKDAFDFDCELIEGRGGIFDVRVNGDLVYSKHESGQFPEHEPLIKRIGKLVAS